MFNSVMETQVSNLSARYEGYKFSAVALYGIPVEILDSVKPFVMKEMREWGCDEPKRFTPPATFDLGFFELSDITDLDYSFRSVKRCIIGSILDYDTLGRSLMKVKYRQLLKKPHKGLCRRVLKSFFLYYYGISQPQKELDEITEVLEHHWDSMEIPA